MKKILAIVAMLGVGIAWAAAPAAPAQDGILKGKVLEVRNVDSYTYLRLKTKDGEIWAAVDKAPLKKGANVAIENAMVMNNFESKALKKTFPQIVFGNLAGTQAAAGAMAAPHGGAGKAVDIGDVKVDKASGPDARTVAEIVGKGAELKDKAVLVRGKVVKFSAEIMGKNWVHLRDGTGSAADGTNDVLVTTQDVAKIGDVVLVKGVVRTDKDFGAGYVYKVLVEEASLK
ncbi:MAG: nucleotide-binding protein [Rhodocyclales bacterium]|nr:nucleotide-binding protein [Rhodocyclales bacterium]